MAKRVGFFTDFKLGHHHNGHIDPHPACFFNVYLHEGDTVFHCMPLLVCLHDKLKTYFMNFSGNIDNGTGNR